MRGVVPSRGREYCRKFLLGNLLVRRPAPFHWLKNGLTILEKVHFTEFFSKVLAACDVGSASDKHSVRAGLDDIGFFAQFTTGAATGDHVGYSHRAMVGRDAVAEIVIMMSALAEQDANVPPKFQTLMLDLNPQP